MCPCPCVHVRPSVHQNCAFVRPPSLCVSLPPLCVSLSPLTRFSTPLQCVSPSLPLVVLFVHPLLFFCFVCPPHVHVKILYLDIETQNKCIGIVSILWLRGQKKKFWSCLVNETQRNEVSLHFASYKLSNFSSPSPQVAVAQLMPLWLPLSQTS